VPGTCNCIWVWDGFNVQEHTAAGLLFLFFSPRDSWKSMLKYSSGAAVCSVSMCSWVIASCSVCVCVQLGNCVMQCVCVCVCVCWPHWKVNLSRRFSLQVGGGWHILLDDYTYEWMMGCHSNSVITFTYLMCKGVSFVPSLSLDSISCVSCLETNETILYTHTWPILAWLSFFYEVLLIPTQFTVRTIYIYLYIYNIFIYIFIYIIYVYICIYI